jgi:insulysin
MTFLFSKLLPALACALALSAPLAAQAQAATAAATVAVPPRDPAPTRHRAAAPLRAAQRHEGAAAVGPQAQHSSASLAVGVGSLADPPQRQGLAHFLEHMLFLGTEKYPDGDRLRRLPAPQRRLNNAYTAEDRTNYFFEIRHEAFEGALDRFAQFFIAPLFDARFTEREINAVASEHQKNLENDLWRELQLLRNLRREGHPARHFGTGSRETLAGTTREELLAFYRSALQRQPHDAGADRPARSTSWSVGRARYFGAVPDHQLPALRLPGRLPAAQARAAHAAHGAGQGPAPADLQFPLPGLHDGWRTSSADLLGFVLGGEGPGSLLAQLKAEGLATGLGAVAQSADTHQYWRLRDLQIGLTPQGLQHVPRVLQLVFSTDRACCVNRACRRTCSPSGARWRSWTSASATRAKAPAGVRAWPAW